MYPTEGSLGRLRQEQGLWEPEAAGETPIFRAMLVVAIALGLETMEDGGKSVLTEAGVWIGGTTTIMSTMGAGEVGVLIEIETGTEPASGTGTYIVDNSWHCLHVGGDCYVRLHVDVFYASLELALALLKSQVGSIAWRQDDSIGLLDRWISGEWYLMGQSLY